MRLKASCHFWLRQKSLYLKEIKHYWKSLGLSCDRKSDVWSMTSYCELGFSFFLGAFAKLRKPTFIFVVSVRPSVRMEQLSSHRKDFHEIWYLRIFGKPVYKIKISWNLTRKSLNLHEDLCTVMTTNGCIFVLLYFVRYFLRHNVYLQ